MKNIAIIIALTLLVSACKEEGKVSSQKKDAEAVDRQQSQYAKAQPIPTYDYSLERDLVIQLYNTRNLKVATHSVWRSNYGQVEGDCPSMGYGLPYDTSLTNPLVAQRMDGYQSVAGVSIGQPEPNGVFASTNTSATWVFCLNEAGVIEPVYVETKVTVYPGPVKIDYTTNRVVRYGKATVTLKK